MQTTFLQISIEYDPALTDAEAIAGAADTLLETALSMPGVLDENGNPRFGRFLITSKSANCKDLVKRLGGLAWQRTKSLFSKLGGEYLGSIWRRFRKDVTRTAKYLLLDLEAVELATTTIYGTFEKAKQDAAELDMVIAIPLIFEVEYPTRPSASYPGHCHRSGSYRSAGSPAIGRDWLPEGPTHRL